jgi:hypothetical protein
MCNSCLKILFLMHTSYEVNVCRMGCVGYEALSLGNRFSASSGQVVATSERFNISKKKPQLHSCENLKNLTGCVVLGYALVPKFKLMSVTK